MSTAISMKKFTNEIVTIQRSTSSLDSLFPIIISAAFEKQKHTKIYMEAKSSRIISVTLLNIVSLALKYTCKLITQQDKKKICRP